MLIARLGASSFQLVVPFDIRCHFPAWQPDGYVFRKAAERTAQGYDVAEPASVDLVYNPEDAVNLDPALSCERAERAVPGKKNASRVLLGKSIGESVMYGKLRQCLHNLLGAQNRLSWKIHALKTAAEERFLLRGRKFQQFLLEQGVRDQELIREPQEDVE